MLLRNSVIVMLEAPAGIVVTCTYPLGKGFLAKTPDMGRHTEFPQRTLPLFINPEPEMTPFFKTACKDEREKIKK